MKTLDAGLVTSKPPPPVATVDTARLVADAPEMFTGPPELFNVEPKIFTIPASARTSMKLPAVEVSVEPDKWISASTPVVFNRMPPAPAASVASLRLMAPLSRLVDIVIEPPEMPALETSRCLPLISTVPVPALIGAPM